MDLSIGQRVRSRRKQLGLSGAQIKAMTGISTGNLSEIENGKILPSAAAVKELAEAFNCTTDWILNGTPDCGREFTPEEIRLLNFFKLLSEKDQQEILLLAEIKSNLQDGVCVKVTRKD